MREPNIIIRTDGITGTEVYVNGEKLEDVVGIRFTQSYKENKGLPVLQIDLKATNVTLDAKMIPALPEPFNGCYLPINALLNAEEIPKETVARLCREFGIELTE